MSLTIEISVPQKFGENKNLQETRREKKNVRMLEQIKSKSVCDTNVVTINVNQAKPAENKRVK